MLPMFRHMSVMWRHFMASVKQAWSEAPGYQAMPMAGSFALAYGQAGGFAGVGASRLADCRWDVCDACDAWDNVNARNWLLAQLIKYSPIVCKSIF